MKGKDAIRAAVRPADDLMPEIATLDSRDLRLPERGALAIEEADDADD